ncbi:hypothetical protein LEN26_017440 [Aphanomyces euteiches]|nr:hypothetical protein LEN26_017440 [Aphanomyces euteiches]KAH9129215.1 hypothetical protein AeMF1_000720 [Aphanomyces euteiches]KAH9193769.1 hypothetical protein AeNC1_004262 [Aphanomyces euteiches]
MLLIDVLNDDTAMMQCASDIKRSLVGCQICFEDFDKEKIVTRICSRSCRAVVCHGCLESYISVRIQSIPAGVLAKLDCPICLIPVNLMRWKARCSVVSNLVDDFASQVAAACNVLCPSCHNTSNVLPLPETTSDNPLKMTSSLVQQVPKLRQICQQYCRHEVSLAELCQFIRDTFGDLYTDVAERIVPLIHDTERRAALFLRLTREQPFIRSSCCNADICFNCLTKGHHDGSPCRAFLAEVEDVAACPSCRLTLVKGDGCDWVTCFCGIGFSWTPEVRRYQFRQVPEKALDALIAVFVPFVQMRRLRRKVLPALKRHVNIAKFHKQFVAVAQFLRAVAHHRRRLHLVLPQLKAQVVMLNITKHKRQMLVVCEFLRRRMWKRRLVAGVLKSHAFHDAILQRRQKYCIHMLQTSPWLKARMVVFVQRWCHAITAYRAMIFKRKQNVLASLLDHCRSVDPSTISQDARET